MLTHLETFDANLMVGNEFGPTREHYIFDRNFDLKSANPLIVWIFHIFTFFLSCLSRVLINVSPIPIPNLSTALTAFVEHLQRQDLLVQMHANVALHLFREITHHLLYRTR